MQCDLHFDLVVPNIPNYRLTDHVIINKISDFYLELFLLSGIEVIKKSDIQLFVGVLGENSRPDL